jgi:cytidine deaminase
MSDPLDELVEAARGAQQRAYAPYSGFRVGAAVRAESGRVYTGCNVENASFGATICAERGAVSSMVAGGDLALSAVAIFTDGPEPAMPCGVCRQVLRELGRSVDVVTATPEQRERATLDELLPRPFVLRR